MVLKRLRKKSRITWQKIITWQLREGSPSQQTPSPPRLLPGSSSWCKSSARNTKTEMALDDKMKTYVGLAEEFKPIWDKYILEFKIWNDNYIFESKTNSFWNSKQIQMLTYAGSSPAWQRNWTKTGSSDRFWGGGHLPSCHVRDWWNHDNYMYYG